MWEKIVIVSLCTSVVPKAGYKVPHSLKQGFLCFHVFQPNEIFYQGFHTLANLRRTTVALFVPVQDAALLDNSVFNWGKLKNVPCVHRPHAQRACKKLLVWINLSGRLDKPTRNTLNISGVK